MLLVTGGGGVGEGEPAEPPPPPHAKIVILRRETNRTFSVRMMSFRSCSAVNRGKRMQIKLSRALYRNNSQMRFYQFRLDRPMGLKMRLKAYTLYLRGKEKQPTEKILSACCARRPMTANLRALRHRELPQLIFAPLVAGRFVALESSALSSELLTYPQNAAENRPCLRLGCAP